MADTTANSYLIHGLFRLLGYQFSPRLARLPERRYCHVAVVTCIRRTGLGRRISWGSELHGRCPFSPSEAIRDGERRPLPPGG